MFRIKFLVRIFLAFIFVYLVFPTKVLAHEQYVLTKTELTKGFADKSLNAFSALSNINNLKIAFFVSLGVITLIVLYFFFQNSKFGKNISTNLFKIENFGHLLIRISLGISLIASAYFHSFLGPEISVQSIFPGQLLVPIMYVLGLFLLFGIFTRIGSILGLLILVSASIVYKDYMFTYFNYFGEYLVLIIFGTYFLAIDNKIFGVSKIVKSHKDLEILVLRVTYGISVLYPAITIKLMHPAVIVEIFNKYHLGNIWWLFPKDALLTSLGTGLAQILVGLMIIFGFETRLAAFVTFLLYLGSVVYFQEAVWPHIVLLALAFYFVINNGGKFTLDTLMLKKLPILNFDKDLINNVQKSN